MYWQKINTFAEICIRVKHKKMKAKFLFATCMLLAATTVAMAQEPRLPKKVENVTILDLNGEKTQLPEWGKKNLMIFYIDPDVHSQNSDFLDDMEVNHRAEGDNLYGFGILNLKDAPMVPNSVARSLARKRTAKNGATVLADQSRELINAWGLGDCNNKFVLLIVSKEGELVYMKKGELSKADIDGFYKFIEKYK